MSILRFVPRVQGTRIGIVRKVLARRGGIHDLEAMYSFDVDITITFATDVNSRSSSSLW